MKYAAIVRFGTLTGFVFILTFASDLKAAPPVRYGDRGAEENWIETQLLSEATSFQRFHFGCFDNSDWELRPMFWFDDNGAIRARLMQVLLGSSNCDAFDVEDQLNTESSVGDTTPWIY